MPGQVAAFPPHLPQGLTGSEAVRQAPDFLLQSTWRRRFANPFVLSNYKRCFSYYTLVTLLGASTHVFLEV